MRLILHGRGRMGMELASLINTDTDMHLMAVIGRTNAGELAQLPAADAIIDFSAPASFDGVMDYVRRTRTALVCGTTGLSSEQMAGLKELGNAAPVLHSANFSIGIAAMRRVLPLLREASGESFDIEMTETHHRGKADAPSGTAKLLLAALDPRSEYSNPATRTGPRGEKEIGVHALRGGNIAGEHSVHFFGPDESLTLSHIAADRKIFAQGALRIAGLLKQRLPGFYTIDDLLF